MGQLPDLCLASLAWAEIKISKRPQEPAPRRPSRPSKGSSFGPQGTKTSQDLPRPPKTIRLAHHVGSKSLTLRCGGAVNDDINESPPPADLHPPCSTAMGVLTLMDRDRARVVPAPTKSGNGSEVVE